MDTLVIDIETKNTFADVGGKQNLLDLKISVVCVYSYQKNKYFIFAEDELEKLKELLQEPAVLVGFSSNKFDLPILSHNLNLNLLSYSRVDISEEVELRTGRLVSLDSLARLNLNEMKKTHKNTDAPRLYSEGKLEELKEYCRTDVEITKKIYDKIKKTGQLVVPPKKNESPEESRVIDIDVPSPLFQ